MNQKTRATIRTIIQTIAGAALVAPLVVDQVGGAEATGWLAGVVAISGVVTRFMASDLGEKLLANFNMDTKPVVVGVPVPVPVDPVTGDIAPVPAPPAPPVPPVAS